MLRELPTGIMLILTAAGSLVSIVALGSASSDYKAYAETRSNIDNFSDSCGLDYESSKNVGNNDLQFDAFDKIRLPFVKNQGQIHDTNVKYYSILPFGTATVSEEGITYSMISGQSSKEDNKSAETRIIHEKFLSETILDPVGKEQSEALISYFVGPAENWQTGVPAYYTVSLGEVWDSIEVELAVNRQSVEKIFNVAPGGNIAKIKMSVAGAIITSIDYEGRLIMRSGGEDFAMTAPVAYQKIEGTRVDITARYAIIDNTTYGFEITDYDNRYPVVIDPAIDSVILHAYNIDEGHDIAIDNEGNVFVVARTWSLGSSADAYPTTDGSYNTVASSLEPYQIVISKFNSDLSQLLASTQIGIIGFGIVGDLAVDSLGNVYVTGSTDTANYPTTGGAFDQTFNKIESIDTDIFISKLDNDLSSLLASTFLGGSSAEGKWIRDYANALSIDQSGNVYIAGKAMSTDFPVTLNAYDQELNGTEDAFIAKLDANLTQLIASTYLGGSSTENALDIVADLSDGAYVAGTTQSTNFPTTPNAYDDNYDLTRHIFIAKLDANLTQLIASTFVHGSLSGETLAIAIDPSGNIFAATNVLASSINNLPYVGVGFDATFNGETDVFVTKINNNLTMLLASTFLGGTDTEWAGDIATDSRGNMIIAGRTESRNFPTTAGAFDRTANGDQVNFDGFISKFSNDLSLLISSTYVGGADNRRDEVKDIVIDNSDDIYVVGTTLSDSFPFTTEIGMLSSDFGNVGDIFIFHLIESPLLRPDRGGNTGTITVSIYNVDIAEGAQIKLTRSGEQDIVGEILSRDSISREVVVRFDLDDKVVGSWDLIFIRPNDDIATFSEVFTIEQGEFPDIWVDIVGRNAMRINQETVYTIVVGNSGNVDAKVVPLTISGIPLDAEWDLELGILQPALSEHNEGVDWDTMPIHIEEEDGISIPLLLPVVPGGSVSQIPLKLTVPIGQDINLRVGYGEPLVQSPTDQDAVTCFLSIAGALAGLIPAVDCAEAIGNQIVGNIAEQVQEMADVAYGEESDTFSEGVSVLQFVTDWAITLAIDCAGRELLIVDIYTRFGQISAAYDCLAPLLGDAVEFLIARVFALDPNEITGLSGFGDERYISVKRPLVYTIFFENVENATAPAQEVVIIDQLDPSTMNLESLNLGSISFGNKIVTSSLPGLPEFSTQVDLRPEQHLIVNIDASVDEQGVLTWRLTSIDPLTGTLPEDPLEGFLPPNQVSPEGEGSVTFTIMPKEDLDTGTVITNEASIIFDNNEPILTNEWFNTIDNTPPESQIVSVERLDNSAQLQLILEGSDRESGLKDYFVYYSEDGINFDPWVSRTADTTLIFDGEFGETYVFYSLATDRAGNTQLNDETLQHVTVTIEEIFEEPTDVPTEPTPSGGNAFSTVAETPRIVDDEGTPVSRVSSGNPVRVEVGATNVDYPEDRQVIFIFEVRDENGITLQLQYEQTSFSLDDNILLRFSWIPEEPGTYTARSFLISSLDAPVILSGVVVSTFVVE